MKSKKVRRQFCVTVTTELIVEIDDKVFAAVDEDWRKTFYKLQTPKEIAARLAECEKRLGVVR